MEQLKDVPKQLDALYQFVTASIPEKSDDGTVEDACQDPIANLISKSANVNPDADNATEPSLLNVLNVMQPEPEYGSPLNSDVAQSITQLYNTESVKNARDKMKDKFKVPENCKTLEVPRVNPEIWSLLPPQVKQKDFAAQQQQQLVSSAAVAVARMTDTLFTTKEPIKQALREDLIKQCMELGSILAIASDDVNKRRKGEIKPAINREFASICSTSKSTGGLLFGENVLDQFKVTKSSSQLVRSASIRENTRGGMRFTPYKRPPLNYQSPSFRSRGAFRQTRGRPMFRSGQQYNRSRQYHQ